MWQHREECGHAVRVPADERLGRKRVSMKTTRFRRLSRIATVLLLAAPAWLGSVAELLDSHLFNQLLLAVNPLAHLAAAIAYDPLHEPWLYRHLAFTTMRYDYPVPLHTATALILVSGLLQWNLARHPEAVT